MTSDRFEVVWLMIELSRLKQSLTSNTNSISCNMKWLMKVRISQVWTESKYRQVWTGHSIFSFSTKHNTATSTTTDSIHPHTYIFQFVETCRPKKYNSTQLKQATCKPLVRHRCLNSYKRPQNAARGGSCCWHQLNYLAGQL